MSSIIPGYEYDIFISYRQKDNRYDGWVTNFVDNLRKELEATFKEEISVYFDENPHDRLQETHNVVKSLEGKLHCLIFIPVLSQTYCDPNCYAWQNEFLAFLSLAVNDRYGKDIRLRSGNVASRILPIRIHDLEQEDIKLFETVTGSPMRSMDFVFRTASGVNRPLQSNEERPAENLNRTLYRDQINKVAGVIKEIILGIKARDISENIQEARIITHENKSNREIKPVEHTDQYTQAENQNRSSTESGKEKKSTLKSKRSKVILTVTFFVILIFIFLATETLTGKRTLSNSIIVLPFTCRDTSQSYFAEGIAVDVITELAKVKNISVLSWNTSAAYNHTSKQIDEIAGETGVSYVLSGFIQREQKNVRINVDLINPRNGKSIWTQSWDQELKYVFDIQKQIAQDVARELGIKLSSEEKARLTKYQTKNFEAYDLFLKAREESRKMQWSGEFSRKSNQLLDEALAIDPDFPQALTLRANNNIDLVQYEGSDPMEQIVKVKEDLYRSLSLDPYYSDTYIVMGIANWWLEWNFKEAKINLEKGWELSNYGDAPITQCFCGIIEYNMANGDFIKALELMAKVEKIDPDYPFGQIEKLLILTALKDTLGINNLIRTYSGPENQLAMYYYELGKYDKVIDLLKRINIEDQNIYGFSLSSYLATAYYKTGMIQKSDSIIDQLIILSTKKRNIDFCLAATYASRNDRENAIKWYQSAFLKHDLNLTSTLTNSDLRRFKDEPEIKEVLNKIGIYHSSRPE